MRRRRRPAEPARRTLALPADGRLRLVVVADTHGEPHPGAAALIAREAPGAILHAGDVGVPTALAPLEPLAPLIWVRGNIDPVGHGWDEHTVVDLAHPDGAPALRVLLTHIAVYGARLMPDVRRLAAAHDADLVVCGHSHVPLVARDGALAVFNPGSIGPRRFRLPITFGVIDVAPEGVALRHVDCETGAAWRPPR